MIHLLGSGTMPSGPEPQERRCQREVREPQQPGQDAGVAQHRVDLLGADDGCGDDRDPGLQRGGDETSASEALQLVPLTERFADALETFGPDPHQFATGHEPFRVRRTRQRRPRLARELADERCLENQISAEHAQMPVRRVMIQQRDLGHQRVDRDGAGWLATTSARRCRARSPSPGLDPEPLLVQRPERRHQTLSCSSGSNPNSSTVYSPVIRRRRKARAPATRSSTTSPGTHPGQRVEVGRGLVGRSATRRFVPADADAVERRLDPPTGSVDRRDCGRRDVGWWPTPGAVVAADGDDAGVRHRCLLR